jgi:hypothetical protein
MRRFVYPKSLAEDKQVDQLGNRLASEAFQYKP